MSDFRNDYNEDTGSLPKRVTKLEVMTGRQDEQLQVLFRWQAEQHEFNKALQKDISFIKEDMSSLRQEFMREMGEIRQGYNNKPSWAVAIVISMLSTLCGGLAIYVITNL